MSFYDKVQETSWAETESSIYSKTAMDVERALVKDKIDLEDFKALISPAAIPYVEQMAAKSHIMTQRRFGNTIQLYIPIYMSNACTNYCVYCGFNHDNDILRKVLTMDELSQEAKIVKELGFEHLLLVSGEDNRACDVNYFKDAITQCKNDFAQISLEVQPLKTEEYKILSDAGLHAVYVYQETYREETYKIYHPKGKKSNYKYRLAAPERMGEAGIHKIGLGVLLGLEDWRTDSFYTAMHLGYLEKYFWKTKFSLSFPRLRPFTGGFEPNSIISSKDLLQLMCAYRLLNEHVEISLSTRESAFYRDHVMKLGVTTMSAGSKTDPGGYSHPNEALEQFSVNDERSSEAVTNAIKSLGYEVVWKDWDTYM